MNCSVFFQRYRCIISYSAETDRCLASRAGDKNATKDKETQDKLGPNRHESSSEARPETPETRPPDNRPPLPLYNWPVKIPTGRLTTDKEVAVFLGQFNDQSQTATLQAESSEGALRAPFVFPKAIAYRDKANKKTWQRLWPDDCATIPAYLVAPWRGYNTRIPRFVGQQLSDVPRPTEAARRRTPWHVWVAATIREHHANSSRDGRVIVSYDPEARARVGHRAKKMKMEKQEKKENRYLPQPGSQATDVFNPLQKS